MSAFLSILFVGWVRIVYHSCLDFISLQLGSGLLYTILRSYNYIFLALNVKTMFS
jgi:hypothetical protein